MRNIFFFILMLAIGVGLAVAGCSKKNPTSSDQTAVDDDTAVTNVVASSGYADVSDYGNDSLSGFAKDGAGAKSDSFPAWMRGRWFRRITSQTKSYAIQFDSSRTFATVTITRDFYGRFIVDNTLDGTARDTILDTLSRTIHDRGTRYVWLKKIHDRWRIWGASPLDIATVSPGNAVTIDSVKIVGSSGPRPIASFSGQLYGQTRRRDEMLVFDQGATVSMTVYGSLAGGYPADSAWTFLHRRIFSSAGGFHHWRVPMVKSAWQPIAFTYTWTVASDSLMARPALRHACADMILGSTLFGGSGAEYSSRMWTIPYIVVNTVNDSLPE